MPAYKIFTPAFLYAGHKTGRIRERKDMNQDISRLEEVTGYKFNDTGLLIHALTHSSYVNEHHMDKSECNERLEFLGDAVLQIVSSDFMYHRFPDKPEGDLTKLRASMVCEPTLAYCASEIGLGDYLLLGKGEEATGGRIRSSVTSDAMEALIGAIYLDGGLEPAREFILSHILNDMEHKQLFFDSKTALQEMIQSDPEARLSYELIGEEGPDHNKSFVVCACLNDEEIGRGSGHTKKAAEAMAAYYAILHLRERD